MATGLASLVASGTRLWLDSVDPGLVRQAQYARPQERGVEHEEPAHRRAQEEHRRVVQSGDQVQHTQEPKV